MPIFVIYYCVTENFNKIACIWIAFFKPYPKICKPESRKSWKPRNLLTKELANLLIWKQVNPSNLEPIEQIELIELFELFEQIEPIELIELNKPYSLFANLFKYCKQDIFDLNFT